MDEVLMALVAAALRIAADEIEGAIHSGDVAEVAAPVEGERGRAEAVQARDELYEDPAGWLRNRAEEMEKVSEETVWAP